MQHFLTALFFVLAFASLGGCGQTGPLYMPPAPEPETAPASVPEAQSAAPADSAAQPNKEP